MFYDIHPQQIDSENYKWGKSDQRQKRIVDGDAVVVVVVLGKSINGEETKFDRSSRTPV